MILEAVVLSCVGVAGEVAFTAVTERKDARLTGHTYLWMFPVYLTLYPGFAFLLPRVGHLHWAGRGALYAVLIVLGELLFGLLLKAALGQAPWEPAYKGKPRVLAGVANLDYLPAWAAGALFYERVYRLLAGV
ncbi:MAG: hypothetical protein SF051_10400 [Elusimicrobiota bacterium]|nr:hypothetical protein [Elusimicrobiota bacterium]